MSFCFVDFAARASVVAATVSFVFAVNWVAKVTTMKANKDRASSSKCVRFDDKQGFKTKFNKTNFPNESRRLMYYYSVKCVEQGMRGFSPTFVATKKKFHEFRQVCKELILERLPEGFGSFTRLKKREAVEKLIDKFDNELVAAMSRRGIGQGVDIQADGSNTMQVGEGSARQFDMTVKEDVDIEADGSNTMQVGEGSARQIVMTVRDDVDTQVNNLDQTQVDEVWAEAPNKTKPNFDDTLSTDASLQNVALNQCDNPEGRPPSRPPVPLEELVFIISDLLVRASRFPGMFPECEWSEEAFRSFVILLESLEGAIADPSTTNSKSHQEELPSLPDPSASEFEHISIFSGNDIFF